MTGYRLIHLSDIHLSEKRAYNQVGWEACLEYAHEVSPDLVITTGDHVIDDPDDIEDQHFARDQLERLPSPWLTVPGNHDIGDTNPVPYCGQHLTDERLSRYRSIFGSDYWVHRSGGWQFIGLNAMLFGADTPDEDVQAEWLRHVLSEGQGLPTAFFMHKPLCIEQYEEPSVPDVCVEGGGRQRLLEIMKGADVRLIANGHNHHYRTLRVGDAQMVWAPSTAQVFRTERPFRAIESPGLVDYTFRENGSFEFYFVHPKGMVTNDVTQLVNKHEAMRNAPLLPWRREEELVEIVRVAV